MPAIIQIINKCNQGCLFCSAKEDRAEISDRGLRNIIKRTDGALVISGGEPLLSKRLIWVIEEAKKNNLFVELQTNGSGLADRKLAAKLVNSGVDLFNINFPSHLASVNDRITRALGIYKKREEGIRNLLALNANVRLTCIINSLNYKKLGSTIDFIKRKFKNIRYIQFSFIKIQGNALKYHGIAVDYQKTQPYLLKALKKCADLGITFIIDHIPPCYLGGFRNHHIDYIKLVNGVSPEYSRQEKEKIARCRGCSWSANCLGIRKDYLKFFKNIIKVYPIK